VSCVLWFVLVFALVSVTGRWGGLWNFRERQYTPQSD